MRELPCFTDREAKKIIDHLCQEYNVDVILLKDLCELMQEHSGSGRREGVVEQFNSTIDRFMSRTTES